MHTPECYCCCSHEKPIDIFLLSRDNDDTASVRKMQKNATGNILQQRMRFFVIKICTLDVQPSSLPPNSPGSLDLPLSLSLSFPKPTPRAFHADVNTTVRRVCISISMYICEKLQRAFLMDGSGINFINSSYAK